MGRDVDITYHYGAGRIVINRPDDVRVEVRERDVSVVLNSDFRIEIKHSKSPVMLREFENDQ